ncbi:MAG: hypothetical protein ACR2JC_14755 [Chloroflexota bacterium]
MISSRAEMMDASNNLVPRAFEVPHPAMRSPARSASGSLAFFGGSGGAYAASPLYVQPPRTRAAFRVGYGDALIRPVWSRDGDRLLYVGVQETSRVPKALWSLWSVDISSRASRRLVLIPALNVAPLGWERHRALFLRADGADSSLYTVAPGSLKLTGILLPQPLVTAFLSPDGRYIAAAAPTGCGWCTLDIYNVETVALWTGPSGIPDERDIAWSRDGRYLATLMQNRLEASTPDGRVIGEFSPPARLPRSWQHLFEARLASHNLILWDTVTGSRYVASTYKT